jgi:hypothetical protein
VKPFSKQPLVVHSLGNGTIKMVLPPPLASFGNQRLPVRLKLLRSIKTAQPGLLHMKDGFGIQRPISHTSRNSNTFQTTATQLPSGHYFQLGEGDEGKQVGVVLKKIVPLGLSSVSGYLSFITGISRILY